MEHGQIVVAIGRAIEEAFTSTEWTEIGYLTDTDVEINNHPRLLRSLSWSDNDYKGHVLDMVETIIHKQPNNLRRLIEYGPITAWLKENDPQSIQALEAQVYGLEVAEILPLGSEIALAALRDAQALLHSRGASSAIDRVHTGLHGFLKGACSQAGLNYDGDATANKLLKTLLEGHPSLNQLGPRDQDIRRVIQTGGAIVDALGTLRNRASLAHPNEELLEKNEALFVINITRSLLTYLDAKFNP